MFARCGGLGSNREVRVVSPEILANWGLASARPQASHSHNSQLCNLYHFPLRELVRGFRSSIPNNSSASLVPQTKPAYLQGCACGIPFQWECFAVTDALQTATVVG